MGATYYICPRREWFSSLEKLDSGVVIMGNDDACQIVGMGTIRIKMFDGVVRNLMNVRYVSQIKKNIILVKAVESNGHKVTLDSQGHERVLSCDEGYQRQELVLLE